MRGPNIRGAPSKVVVDYGSGRRPAGKLEPTMPVRVALPEHVPENAMVDPQEIARFYDRCSDLMRVLLDELARVPDRPRAFPMIEDALGWPHRRIASVLGGVCHLRRMEFAGRRPYHFQEPRAAASRRWEMWMDSEQARLARAERDGGSLPPDGHW